ncbi:MAG: cytochrome c oxidase subunit II [Hyphomicrobiales bacterium]|nr:MAG: cytochrome c oxidase subunit II [Hyphomicrobiales bacterium]
MSRSQRGAAEPVTRLMPLAGTVPLAALVSGCSASPMSYLSTEGPAADPVTLMGWGFTAIAAATTLIISGLLLWAVVRHRPLRLPEARETMERGGNGLKWIYVGTLVSTPVLFGMAVWMVAATAAVIAPGRPTALTIQVIGHQWWWELRYLDHQKNQSFIGANEIHVPAGVPVKLELMSADVIHSFWIPKLSGKMDLVPGQLNETWIEASHEGEYRGQCAEFCGAQHANMVLLLVADNAAAFEAWWNAHAQPQGQVADAVSHGRDLFMKHCGECHTVDGTAAKGKDGPNLTHVASRRKIGANIYPNKRGHLGGWIADAPTMKPRVRMPAMAEKLPGGDLIAVLDYVQSLH